MSQSVLQNKHIGKGQIGETDFLLFLEQWHAPVPLSNVSPSVPLLQLYHIPLGRLHTLIQTKLPTHKVHIQDKYTQ